MLYYLILQWVKGISRSDCDQYSSVAPGNHSTPVFFPIFIQYATFDIPFFPSYLFLIPYFLFDIRYSFLPFLIHYSLFDIRHSFLPFLFLIPCPSIPTGLFDIRYSFVTDKLPMQSASSFPSLKTRGRNRYRDFSDQSQSQWVGYRLS